MRYNGIIILLVFCLTLLLLTGRIVNAVIPETTSGNLENQENTEEPIIENTEEPGKWSGLGMGGIFSSTQAQKLSYLDILIANGFTEFRTAIPDYHNTGWVDDAKWVQQQVIAKGGKSIWGVCAIDLTAANWGDYRTAILSAAQWAQDNGVYEFQLGNEEEDWIDGTTLTLSQLIANLKSVATEVQGIFTNGNVSYSCFHENIDDWVTAGKGDIDILASNIYKEWGAHIPQPWEDEIDTLVDAFGTDGTYLTEFGPNSSSLDSYSTDEAAQAAAVTEMIEYIKASGMTRAYYYCWKDDGKYHFGVVKADGTYRLLWNQALLNTGPVESTTVPTKTTTISLPDTIALIQK